MLSVHVTLLRIFLELFLLLVLVFTVYGNVIYVYFFYFCKRRTWRVTLSLWIGSTKYIHVFFHSSNISTKQIGRLFLEQDCSADRETQIRGLEPYDICDVISEKGPYCGKNSVFLDQLFLHFCDSIFYQNCAVGETNVSFRCSLATNIVGPDQTPRIMCGFWSGPMIFVPQ